MAKNTKPIFELTPRNAYAVLAAANTASDGSGTIVTLVAGGTDGTRIDEIRWINGQATAAADSARVGKVWLSIDSGTTWNLIDEVAITTTTRSTTVVGGKFILTYPTGIVLKDSTHIIGVTISVYAGVQDRTVVVARGGDFS